MKKILHFIHFIKEANKTIYLLLFLLSSAIGFTQTITPTKIVTVAPGVCGALDVELKIQGTNPVSRPLEVVLVIDVSSSMGSGNNPKPLARAQDAAIDFINKMFLPANNPTQLNKIAIVTYGTTATIKRNLTDFNGQADLISVINSLVANGNTNIQDGLVKAKTVLNSATYDCATARSVVLLTDGVPNVSGTGGNSCNSCLASIVTAANAVKTVTVSGTTYNNQIFSVGLFGAINGTDQTNAENVLNSVQSGGSFFTENAADLTGIYTQIFTQLSWVAKQITGTPFEKETVDPNFIIGTVTASKGTTTVTGQQIAWNFDFLNVETITLKYRLTPKPNTCGNQMVSTSRLDFQNAVCTTTFQDIVSPTTNVPCPIITLASQTNVSCFGGHNGSITLNNPTGGQGPYTFKWTKNNVDYATTRDISSLTFGTYKVTATDNNNCATGILTVEITQPAAALALGVSGKTDVSCFGASTGTVTAGTVTNAVGTVTYSWKNSLNAEVGTTPSVSNLPSGTYTLTVTDSCSSQSNSVEIGQPAGALTASVNTKTDVSCKGDATGSATASASGGTAGYSYSWNTVPVQASATATGLKAGTYIVTVTDAKGCTDIESVEIGEPSNSLTAAIDTKTDVNCKADATGSATASASGGNGSYSYSWNTAPVQASATATGLKAGTYIVTVTDSKGCTDTESVEITEPSNPLTASVNTKTDVNCKGDVTGSATASASGGNGSYSYSWNTNPVQASATATGLKAGIYIVTVTDSKGCTDTKSVEIGEPANPLTCSIAQNQAVTSNGLSDGKATVTPIGGNGQYTYSWDNGETTAQAIGLNFGQHIVTVTDAKGCTTTCNITISEPNVLFCNITQDDPAKCFGDNNGKATVTANGGNGDYTYLWDNGETTTQAIALTAGSHTVTVTDKLGYTTTCNVVIGQPQMALTASVNTKTDVSCKGDTTGSATASASGGNGSYSYSWNTVPVQASATATGLKAGIYIVTVTDAKGCTDTESVEIGEPANPLTCSIAQNQAVTSNGLSDGKATVTPIGGNGQYTYSWDNGETTAQAIGLNFGQHIVTVTDAKGCTTTCNITISEPNVLFCNITQDDPAKCFGDNNGKATVTANGGNGDYTYLWDNGETTTQAIALTAGSHTVTVTDKLGYTTTCNVVIGQPQMALTASVNTKTDVSCKGDTTGSATASASGGTAGYSYSWNTVPVQASATATGLKAGTYMVTVTDAKGCTDTESVEIGEPSNPLTAAIDTKTDVSCKGDATGSATASASGGNGSYSYSWNTAPVQASATATGLKAGTYMVTVTDAKGCTDTESVEIGEPANPLTASVNTKTDVSCKGDATGSATASASGGNGSYSYSWNTAPVQASATATGLKAGTYMVTVTDAKGCTDTESVEIGEPANPLTASVNTKTDVSCKGDATGSATASASGGNGSYSYSWTTVPVQASATATGLKAGIYIVTVTDAKGCTDTESVEITEPLNPLTASVNTKTDVSCKGDATGSATASASGGNGSYSYSWNTAPVQASATATGLKAGTYMVTVTDAKGCTDTESVEIGEPANPLTASVNTKTDVSCKGDATGSATASASGGNGSYSYSWTTVPVQASATATGLKAGIYIVTVTDAKGCTDTESVEIGEPLNPLTASVNTKTDVSCKGDATGSATASASGGTVGYSYSWNTAPVQASATATGLKAGTYIVTVTDSKGCTDTESVEITEPSNPLTASVNTKTDVSCKGDATGSATASASGGNGSYSYSWNTVPVQASATATGLKAGTYIVTVTDAKGCTDSESVEIGEPLNPLTASVNTKTDVSCKGDTTGSATASASGGNGSYSYSWNTNPVQASVTATGLKAGTYIVTVTDSKGCTDTESVEITEPSNPLTASVNTKTDVSCKGDATGSATASASGGNGSYSYSWNTVPVQASATATGLKAGIYIVTVTDAKGCTDTESVEITEPSNPLTASVNTKTDVSCKGDATGSATASASGGNGSYSYSWNTVPVQASATATGLKAGTYIVTVTDAKGCTDIESVEIGEPSNPLTATTSQTNVGCGGDNTGTATVTVSGGTTQYTYLWSPSGGNAATATGLIAGTYSVTVTDAKQCTITKSVTILDGDSIIPIINPLPETSTINCPALPVFAQATATDENGTVASLTFEDTVTPGNCVGSYTTTRTWTAKDACGNISLPVSQTIIAQDIAAPTWTTQTASLNATIECSNTEALASAQALFPTAEDLCDSDVSNITKESGQFVASEGCSNAGTYTNTWTVKDDCGNTSDIFTQVITIQDTTAPVFTGDLPQNITVSCDAVPVPATIEASDNCNGDLPIVFSEIKSDIQNECGTNYTLTRKWTTSDCGGNQASYTQIIKVEDTTAPTGTAPADVANLQNIADIPVGNPGDIKDAADNCSQNVTITVSDSNNGGSGCDGSAYILTRTYILTDCAGNKTELKQTFTVENKVSVSAVVSNVTCLGKSDGLILVTSSPESTVVITNANNQVVGNTNLPAGTYTLRATSSVNNEGQTCTATTTVIITEPGYTIKVSGQVINTDTNTPIANVPVTLIPQGATPGPILFRLTGADGMYSFSGMAAASYLVQVQDANLNSAYQLYPVDSSLFFTTLEDCKFQVHNFEYGKSKLPVLGDYVWYDTNGNGIQDEWYDANNDGVVTKNIPDAEGAIDYSLWEWIDFNGDGSYTGPQNAGELNAGGFGNALSSNVIIDGPNGYHDEVIVGIQGYWRNRPDSENPYGQYNVKLVRDANLDAVAAALGATGLVKVIPSATDKKITSKTNKVQMHTVCQTTTDGGYIVNVTPEDLVHLDIDFGVNCKEYRDIVANDDSAGPIPGVNHTTTNVLNVLPNDTIESVVVTASDVIITTVTPNEFLQLNPDGSVDVLPNAPTGTLTMVYQICEADQTSNCDTATVTVTIEAPVMTVTATAICVNDVPYVDYVVTPGNFTPVNGVTIAWADSNNNVITTMNNLPLSGRVLWPGAVVDQAGNGVDWPGWLFQNNQWIQGPDGFEKLRPTATLTISVNPSQTIVVNYPPADPYCIARPTFAIVANDDTAGPISGNTGGTNVVNVYTNDNLNGNPLNPADVTLTTVTPDPTGVLTLNPDGSVNVPPDTPTGTYTLTYQICENADFGNCDTAIVTITVVNVPPVINALADTYSVSCNGYGAVGNVLSNDTIDLTPAVISLLNFTLLPSTNGNPGITVDGSGNVNVAATTPSGTYNYDYQICLKKYPNVCVTRTITITVLPNITNLASEACADDSTLVDLMTLLPENAPATGTWVDINNSNALQGSVLNPFGLALGNYVFEYRIADPNCPKTVLLSMEINDDCKVLACGNVVVHNAFSPNGDGINDVFTIDSIDEITCYPENTVEIYNRWGILVFETSNYNNTTNAFDGTSRGRTTVNKSDGLPTGTYFYIINYKSLDGNNVMQSNKKDGYLYLSK